MEQLAIALFGVTAVWLSQDKSEKRRKYAPILGLCSQPFWFYSSFRAEQWGIFFLSVLYTWSWIKGIRNYWFNNKAYTRLIPVRLEYFTWYLYITFKNKQRDRGIKFWIQWLPMAIRRTNKMNKWANMRAEQRKQLREREIGRND